MNEGLPDARPSHSTSRCTSYPFPNLRRWTLTQKILCYHRARQRTLMPHQAAMRTLMPHQAAILTPSGVSALASTLVSTGFPGSSTCGYTHCGSQSYLVVCSLLLEGFLPDMHQTFRAQSMITNSSSTPVWADSSATYSGQYPFFRVFQWRWLSLAWL